MKSFLNKLKVIIFGDPAGKLLSVVIATFIWYYVNIISLEKIYLSLPVSLVNVPKDKDIEIPKDLVVSVEISAHEDVSRRIEDLTAIIDLTNYQIGERNYPISLQNLPNDIQARVSPEYRKILIYDIVTNIIPINLRVTSNSLLTNVTHSPKNIAIVGSTKILDTIKALNTETFTYKVPIQNHLKTNVEIVVPNRVQVLNPQSIEVTLHFNQKLYTNNVLMPIEYEYVDTNFLVEGSRSVPLVLLTVVSNIESLLLDSKFSLDFTDIVEVGEYEMPLQIQTPTNMLVLDAPEFFAVNVMIKEETETETETEITTDDTSLEEFNRVAEESLEELLIIAPVETTDTNSEEL